MPKLVCESVFNVDPRSLSVSAPTQRHHGRSLHHSNAHAAIAAAILSAVASITPGRVISLLLSILLALLSDPAVEFLEKNSGCL